MEKLKYTTDDTMVMIDAFCTLTKEGVTKEEMKEKILSLCNYPVDVVEKFVTAANAVSEKMLNPENRFGILAYITLRINL